MRDRQRLVVLRTLKELSYGWFDIPDIAKAANHPECSVSRRLRELRYPKYGNYDIERKVFRINNTNVHKYQYKGIKQ